MAGSSDSNEFGFVSVARITAFAALLTSVGGVIAYFLGHRYHYGWLRQMGFSPNLFPVSFRDTVIAGGDGTAVSAIGLLATREAFTQALVLGVKGAGVVLVSLLIGGAIVVVGAVYIRPRVSAWVSRLVDDAWLKFARDHAEPLGKVTKLVGAVLVAPAVLYYLGLAFSLLYLLPVAGMESAGRGAANRTLVVYRDELKNPIDCEGGPRVIWKKHDGSLGRGIAPICSDKACGVITPTGSETVLLDDVQRLWVPCAIKGAKNLLETPEEAVHSKTGNAVEK